MVNNKTTNSRLPWIDFLRGLAIIMVVLGHRGLMTEYYVFTSPVKMPLFFLISGFFFSVKGSFPSYCKKLSFRLILPWVLLSLIPYLFYPVKLPEILLSIVLGENAWFFPCLIIDSLLIFCLIKWVTSDLLKILISIALIFSGQILTSFGSPNIWMVNTALVCQSYMLAAFLFKKYFLQLLQINFNSLLFYFAAYLVICYAGYFFFHTIIDVHVNRYYNAFFCVPSIILGCYTLFVFASKYIKKENLISVIGRNTLLIYMWDSICGLIIISILKYLHIYQDQFWLNIIIGLADCIILAVLSTYIRKFCPILIGEKRVKNKIVDSPNL